MPKSRLIPPADGARLAALDPTTLGRPFHLLPAFLRLAEQELADFVAHELNTRYRSQFQLKSLQAGQPGHDTRRRTWHRVDSACVGISVARPLLLHILEYRYGGRETAPAAPAQPQRETETERRLARMLGERLAARLIHAVRRLAKSGLPVLKTPPAVETLPFPPGEEPAWEMVLTLGEAGSGGSSQVGLALDAAVFGQVLRQLSRHGEVPTPSKTLARPFSEQLTITLNARVMEKRLTLGEIIDLQVGTVLPVSLQQQADVYIGRTRVFSASVAESHGKLCLTTFDDAE